MKKMGYAMLACGVVAAGAVTYVLMNKNTKQKADKLLNTMMDEANSAMKHITK